MSTIAVLTLTAHPELTAARYAVLRFERGPAPQRRPWYTATVTATLASQIRQLAAERGYDKLDADAQRAMRRELADELGTKIQNVAKALVQTGRQGPAPVARTEHHCPTCGQELRTLRAREEVARNLAKSTKRKR